MPLFRSSILSASLALAAALTAAGAGADPATPGNLPAPTTPQQKTVLVQLQDAFTNIAQTVEPTVVNIKSERVRTAANGSALKSSGPPRRLEATGSGVIVRADGYILTNDHVVEGAKDGVVTVTLADGREFPGKVYPDFSSDLAVVKINPGPAPLPVAGFADDAAVRPGQWAIAIGSPFDLQNTMTVGVISAIGRHQSIGGEAEGETSGRYYPDLLQTDAAINPGNSGGPLFNIDGKVVGINVAIESPVEGSAGVGFAIPSSIAQTVMNALIRSGKVTRGYFGIAPEDLTPALQTLYGQKDGALVRDVSTDSPAGRAGIEAGDIVTAYDNRPIHGEVSLREAISGTVPGKTVPVGYVRDGRPGAVSVTLGTAPPNPFDLKTAPVAPPATPPARLLGFVIRTLAAADRVELHLPATVRGVLVTAVTPGSPAETAGSSSGLLTLNQTVIQKIGHQEVATKSEYDQAVSSQPPGSAVPVVLLYVSEGADRQREVHQTVLTLQP